MTTPTPGQPLSEADVRRAHAAWMMALAKLPDDVEVNMTTDEAQTAIRAALEAVIRPHAPVSRPGDGVEWPAVTNAWAETYCELTGKNPDGQQVTFVDGATVTTFRDMAKREIEAMLCAAPKAAVRAIAALTPPAEPVSRPAGEGEREAAARAIQKAIGEAWIGQHQAEVAAEAVLSLLSPAAPDAEGVEAMDHAEYDVGAIGNYYGGLTLKREGGVDYWSIENWDGHHWSVLDSRIADAIRVVYPVPALQPGGER